MASSPSLRLIVGTLIFSLALQGISSAQPAAKIPPEVLEQMKKNGGKPPSKPPSKPSSSKKPGDDKKGAPKKDEKKDAKGGDKSSAKTITRPTEPKKPADAKELEARPDADNKLLLNFRGHSWQAMIEWFGDASGREIEWQELPNGFVNLRSQRRYTMEETLDLLNRRLLTLGYTMLDDGEFLLITKTEGINSALVPRVRSSQLGDMLPHSFVKTSFALGRAKVTDVIKELENMKSKNGKLTPMESTNRLEAMDSVRNLLEIHASIEEQASSGRYAPREFRLRYIRAEDAKSKIEEMLGAKKSAAPMTPQQMQAMAQARARAAQQNKGKPQPAAPKEEKISIVVNATNNSIIVKAPPHRMMDIEDTLDFLDIEKARGGLDSYIDRVKTYRFTTLNPEEVKNILMETAGLDPSTTIRTDKSSKSIIVDAPPWDHMMIQKLAKKLDGSAREFKVIQLRRLGAVQVATTVEAMMGEPKEEKSNRRRYSYYYSYYNNDDEDDNKGDKFRIGADTENNRLLLKCNQTEYETVLDLLRQLGEVPRGDGIENQVVFEGVAGDEDELLRRVQEAFSRVAPNQVILPPAKPKKVEEDKEKGDAAEEEPKVDPVTEARDDKSSTETTVTSSLKYKTLLVQAPGGETKDAKKTPPPIVIQRNSQGNLVLKSTDPIALEMFEETLRRMAPRREDWVHFKLKYVTAYWMKLQLEDFFKEEDESPGRGRYIYFYEDYGGKDDKKAPGLGDQPTLRFIDDGESTLVVRNASSSQLATIKRLIDLYDITEPPNKQNSRYREIIQLQYAKARVVEGALKEAFRDLLSNKDKVFDEQKKDGEGGGSSRSRRGGFFGFGDDDDSTTGLGTSTFKGKISFGVDEASNILIITTEGEQLMKIIVEMVTKLDKANVTTDYTQVVSVPANLNGKNLREKLEKMFGQDVVTTKPNDGQNKGQGQNGQPKPNGNGNKKAQGQK